ncbi:MAG: hypothetical protein A2020_02630 [Lentisphaerae bacterium GWF2_45_14]|nr:MAG: hypothetical protein A2020_02630 [Lentisphaerae bacterium GWF2_45_14]
MLFAIWEHLLSFLTTDSQFWEKQSVVLSVVLLILLPSRLLFFPARGLLQIGAAFAPLSARN